MDDVQCPKCGSTQIHSKERGWTLGSGSIGADKIEITCLKCGKKWVAGEKKGGCLNKIGWIIIILVALAYIAS